MAQNIRQLTDFDFQRLNDLISSCAAPNSYERALIDDLHGLLKIASVVNWFDIAPDVVTMNSRLVLRYLDDDELYEIDLVFPEDSNPLRNKVSILTPLGLEILGRSTGGIFDLEGAGHKKRLIIEGILYQPESNKKQTAQ